MNGNARTVILVVVVVVIALILIQSCKRIEIHQKSNDQRTSISLDIEKNRRD